MGGTSSPWEHTFDTPTGTKRDNAENFSPKNSSTAIALTVPRRPRVDSLAALNTPDNSFSRQSIDATRSPTLTELSPVTPGDTLHDDQQCSSTHHAINKPILLCKPHAPSCHAQRDDAYTTASNTKILKSELTTLCKHIVSEPSPEGTHG